MKKESTQSFVDNIKNLSEKTGTDRLILQRLHMMECFLDRLSRSPYKDQFILKGGVLIAAIFGTKLRPTMDIDEQADPDCSLVLSKLDAESTGAHSKR